CWFNRVDQNSCTTILLNFHILNEQLSSRGRFKVDPCLGEISNRYILQLKSRASHEFDPIESRPIACDRYVPYIDYCPRAINYDPIHTGCTKCCECTLSIDRNRIGNSDRSKIARIQDIDFASCCGLCQSSCKCKTRGYTATIVYIVSNP